MIMCVLSAQLISALMLLIQSIMIPRRDQLSPLPSPAKRYFSLNTFRVRTVPVIKCLVPRRTDNVVSKQRIQLATKETSHHSLRALRQRRYETKKSQPNAREQSQPSWAEQNIYHRILKTEQAEFRDAKVKEKIRQIAKIFDPKTIQKMGRRNTNSSTEHACRQPSKPEFKNYYRFRQYGLQERAEDPQSYWKKVNESLILAANSGLPEESKDLRQLFECL